MIKTIDHQNPLNLSAVIQHASLNPHVCLDEINQICDTCARFNISGFCTTLNHLSTARKRLPPSGPTKLIAPIAFPFGAIPSGIKIAEADFAIQKGVDELDLIPNFLALSEGNLNQFAEEIAMICELGVPVRVALDLLNLSKDKLSLAIEASVDAGAIGVISGNGFGPSVTELNITQITKLARNRCEIKAVGGIKGLDQAIKIIEAGATFIGTSAGPELIKSLNQKKY